MGLMALHLVAGGSGGQQPQDADRSRGFLSEMPQGFHLHEYDDCGVNGRQPHVSMDDAYFFTFATSDTEADLKARSAVFSDRALHVRYDDLDREASYVVAVTYASDHVYHRVQSLWANGVELHGPLPLPQAEAIRRLVRLPLEVTRSGRLELQIRIHGEVNATLSIIELWADRPRRGAALRLADATALVGNLTGQLQDLAFDPLAGAEVELWSVGEERPLARSTTGGDGKFEFARPLFEARPPPAKLELRARHGAHRATWPLSPDQLWFEPIRYRPRPSAVGGLDEFERSLDGLWRIDPDPDDGSRDRPLDDPAWRPFRVPGQWKQQGIDVPMETTVAVAREFDIPAAWEGRRIFLRFDAVHAGTSYVVNGHELGGSENLFTPVEWEITPWIRWRAVNRLDLSMRVDTLSERLSHASGYAFHNLGGIDRSVRLFALPPTHVRGLRLEPRLVRNAAEGASESASRGEEDGTLDVALAIDCPPAADTEELELRLRLFDPAGQEMLEAARTEALGSVSPGVTARSLSTRVAAPSLWTAEHPHRYRVVLELRQRGSLLQQIERQIGFRTIEIRGQTLLINGVPVKLAGACRHEIDPLTGRADTMRHAEEDVRLLKEANLNYIRTAHYPPTMELVEAADRRGMYLEVEAPFCWVGPQDDLASLRQVLTPTSAMIDFYHDHPSVIVWSLANESTFNRSFEISNQWVKQLDPTRPTTFNFPDPNRVCDVANVHYPPMPFDQQLPDDPRPLLLGEYFFPVCHEQTDVRINPGLREWFGMGHADPASEWGRQCDAQYRKPFEKPGEPPGAWSHIAHSPRLAGGAIWAALDDAFYFPDGSHAGYAWHHGFWGIADAWRRPKPEWWLTKLIFSPVWFPLRQLDVTPGETFLRIPVENRYSFTDLRELSFTWTMGTSNSRAEVAAAPGSAGELRVPLPSDFLPGQMLRVDVHAADGRLITVAAIAVGRAPPQPLPEPQGPPPDVAKDGSRTLIQGTGFALVFDRDRGELVADDPRHQAACLRFPRPHLTQYDFGDLAGSHGKPYAVYPDELTRVVERTGIELRPEGVELIVEEQYDRLAGTMRWLIDRQGRGRVTYRYTYRGQPLESREAGIRWSCPSACQELVWRRWSEWGVFPEDSICRTEGQARAWRPGTVGADPDGIVPAWPWSLDQTELGTADFRSVKYHIYQAELASDHGAAIRVHAQADRHVRASVADNHVLLHVLTRCDLGQVTMQEGDLLEGSCVVQLVPPPGDGE